MYWNGSTWDTHETWLGAVTATPWVNPWAKGTQLPPSDNFSGLQDGLQYTVMTRAYDVAANTQSVILGGNSFTFDISSPTAAILLPLNGSRYNTLPLVTGTAADAFNVDFPQVRVYDVPLNKYWMGGTGTGGGATLPGWVDTSCPAFPEIWNVSMDSSSTGAQFTWRYDASSVTWPDRDNELRI